MKMKMRTKMMSDEWIIDTLRVVPCVPVTVGELIKGLSGQQLLVAAPIFHASSITCSNYQNQFSSFSFILFYI